MIEVRTTTFSERLQELTAAWQHAVRTRDIIAADAADDDLCAHAPHVAGTLSDEDWQKLLKAATPAEYSGGCVLPAALFEQLLQRAGLAPMDTPRASTLILLPR